MNNIVLIGRLTKDPEVKHGQSGKAYSRFTLAVNRPMQKDEADFINCVAFGNTAEVIKKYCKKGSRVGVIGRLQMNRYESNGEKRTTYDVMINQLEFLTNKGENAPSGSVSNVQENTNEDEFPF